MAQKLRPVKGRVRIEFTWYEPNKRRDPDNVVFAKKFILDGLVRAGILENDGWRIVTEFSDKWIVSKSRPRVELFIVDI